MVALTTLATLKAELGITDSSSDTRLTALIGQVSAAIETYLDRRLGTREVLDTFTGVAGDLYLSAWPVTSSVTVIENGRTLTSGDYVLDAAEGIVRQPYAGVRYGVGYGSPCGYNYGYWHSATVAYTGGYVLPGEEDSNLPADIERAALDLAIRYHHGGGRDPALRSETVPGVIEQSWSVIDRMETVGGLPVDVARSLSPYRRAYL